MRRRNGSNSFISTIVKEINAVTIDSRNTCSIISTNFRVFPYSGR
jgi:hypothetical protein